MALINNINIYGLKYQGYYLCEYDETHVDLESFCSKNFRLGYFGDQKIPKFNDFLILFGFVQDKDLSINLNDINIIQGAPINTN